MSTGTIAVIGILLAAFLLGIAAFIHGKKKPVPETEKPKEDLVGCGHIFIYRKQLSKPFEINETVFRKRINQLVRAKMSRGYSVKSMCREIKVNPSTLSEWRRGEAFPTRKNMERVARYFGVSVQWLCSEGAEKEYRDLLDETKNKA